MSDRSFDCYLNFPTFLHVDIVDIISFFFFSFLGVIMCMLSIVTGVLIMQNLCPFTVNLD